MTYSQLQKEIGALSTRQQIKILETLEETLFPRRVDQMAAFLRARTKTTSYKKIAAITQKVRKQLYA